MYVPSNPRKTALITGITGQDGAYLAEFHRQGLHGAWATAPLLFF
jgi:hypothetical protein